MPYTLLRVQVRGTEGRVVGCLSIGLRGWAVVNTYPCWCTSSLLALERNGRSISFNHREGFCWHDQSPWALGTRRPHLCKSPSTLFLLCYVEILKVLFGTSSTQASATRPRHLSIPPSQSPTAQPSFRQPPHLYKMTSHRRNYPKVVLWRDGLQHNFQQTSEVGKPQIFYGIM